MEVSGKRAASLTVHRAAGWTNSQVAELHPGAFALVMATGIISNAFFLEGYRAWADLLFAVILFAYPCLILFTLLRLALFSRAVWRDLSDPRLVFSFFTVVAGTGVFGVALHLRGFATAAMAMWLFALALWFVLVYFSFAVLIFLNSAGGANIVHGGWLNAIVGTQSLAILGVIIAPETGALRPAVFVLAHMLWGMGLALYGIFITLFAHRIFFSDIDPDDISPVLWVVMGAAAITTNAGSMHPCRQWRILSAIDAATDRWRHSRHVGMGDVVDTFAADAWNLETRHPTRAAELHADALEPGVPTWHVCGGDPATVARCRVSSSQTDLAGHDVGGACGMDRDRARLHLRVLAKLSAVRARQLADFAPYFTPIRPS